MKKLTIEQQCKRIQEIMKHENMVTCDHCKETYLPLTNEAEYTCQLCGMELYEDVIDLDICDDYEVTEL